jgi:hypothetical protein
MAIYYGGSYFDGCIYRTKTLQEAKGRAYAKFIGADGEWKYWYVESRGAEGLENQMKGQSEAATTGGWLVRWDVAEESAAKRLARMADEYPNVFVVWNREANVSIESIELSIYWGNREETAAACAARFVQTALALSKFDPCFARWSLKFREFCAMPPDLGEVTERFEAARQYYEEPPDKPWPEFGFWLSPGNGRERLYGVTYSFHVGCFDTSHTCNWIKITFWGRRLDPEGPWRIDDINRVLLIAADAWDPAYAVVTSKSFHPFEQRDERQKYVWPWAGLSTSLAPPLSRLLSVPPGVDSRRYSDGSLLVTLCRDGFDPGNPIHVERAMQMQAAMAPAQKAWNWSTL